MSRLIFTSILILFTIVGFSQRDTIFWFAVPEVSEFHADRPIVLRLTSFEDDTDVKISVPANDTIIPIELSLNSNGFESIDLTPWIDVLECKQADSVLNNGLLVESTKPIRALYDVVALDGGRPSNSEYFTLKGNKGLGYEFYLPFQNKYERAIDRVANVNTSFDIVATEDSTLVTIYPTGDLVNHVANDSFQVMLMLGQTYSGVMQFNDTSYLTGTYVKATKKIAVTLKDDSVYEGETGRGYGWDLIGDQLYPTSSNGQEFVLQGQRIHIVAQEDATVINIRDTATIELNRGESAKIELNGPPSYIGSNKPISVFHIKSFQTGQQEPSGAAIPGMTCNSANETRIYRYNNEVFKIILVTRKGAEYSFMIDSMSVDYLGDEFQTVLGSDSWVYLEYELEDYEVEPEQSVTITNTLAPFDLAYGAGGYHSQYAFISDDITYDDFLLFEDDKLVVCDSIVNILEAPAGFEEYAWNTGAATQSIEFDTSGIYIVTATEGRYGDCRITDSIEIDLQNSPSIDLRQDFELCANDSVVIGPDAVDSLTYSWNTGLDTSKILIENGGSYVLTVATASGCTDVDSLYVTEVALPTLSLPSDTVLCTNEQLVFDFTNTTTTYIWDDAGETNYREISFEGDYGVLAYTEANGNRCAELRDSINVSFWNVKTYNLLTPNGDNKNDQFIVEGMKDADFKLTIFNRWGEALYQFDDYDNTWMAEDLNSGIYFYELSQDATCNEYTGWVHVLK